MTENEREEWVYDLAVQWINRISPAGVKAMAIDRAVSILEKQTDDQLKAMEVKPKNKKMHGFKKKEKPFGFN